MLSIDSQKFVNLIVLPTLLKYLYYSVMVMAAHWFPPVHILQSQHQVCYYGYNLCLWKTAVIHWCSTTDTVEGKNGHGLFCFQPWLCSSICTCMFFMNSQVYTVNPKTCFGVRGGSSSWLGSSSPPPVTPLTITLSELFLLLCGKMAERKCVYTVILLSVCVQFDPDQNFLWNVLKHFYEFSVSLHPHPHLSRLTISLLSLPLTLFHHQWQKRQTGSLQR